MTKQDPSLERKIHHFLDQQFASVGESRQLRDLKEELATNLREKIEDYRLKGLDEQQAFQEAIISLGDLSGLVEDMRKYAQPQHQHHPSILNQYLTTTGIVLGVLLILFGLFIGAVVYFSHESIESSLGMGIFIVLGGSLLAYSVLTRETEKRIAMNKIRAGLYAVAIGSILFGVFSGIIAGVTTGQIHAGIAVTFVFFLAGIGILLALMLTEKNRSKEEM